MPEVKVNTEAHELLREYAGKKEITKEEAASKLIIVAINRLNATDKYAKSEKGKATAKAKGKPKLKVVKGGKAKAKAKAKAKKVKPAETPEEGSASA